MTEFKDLKFDVMCNMFKKANAVDSNANKQQRKQEAGTSAAKMEGVGSASKAMSQTNKLANKLVPPDAARGRAAQCQARRLGSLQWWVSRATSRCSRLSRVMRSASRSGSTCTRSPCSSVAKAASSSTSSGNDARAQGYTPGNGAGNWEIFHDSEITGEERCCNKFKISLSLPQARFAFINSQSLTVGQAKDTDAMTTLEFDEFKEWRTRIRQMSVAVRITSFCKNLRGEHGGVYEHGDARYNWKRYSLTLPGQALKDHKKLEMWQRLEISDMYYFPLWGEGVHDILQKHFAELTLIFHAYCRSLLGSGSAVDAMEMAEFHDFVDECGLETKHVSFDLMTNNFITMNATNSGAGRDQSLDAPPPPSRTTAARPRLYQRSRTPTTGRRPETSSSRSRTTFALWRTRSNLASRS